VTNLTQAMKRYLLDVARGSIQKRGGRFVNIDNPGSRVSVNSIEALYRRGLITWRGFGGITHHMAFGVTTEGQEIVDELESNEYQS